MIKWVLRLFISALALLALVVVVAVLAVRASLPTLDGALEIEGLGAAASIARDASGVPVISAANRDDLSFATGFAHGQDRFFQMDLIRRQAAGELSELFGEVAVDTDKRHRFHRFRALARQVLEAASDADRQVIERYADGVNAGLASLGAKPFEYMLLGHTPQDWQAEDTIVVVYAMFMQLNDARARRDVRRGYAHRLLPEQVYNWLYPDGTEWDAPVVGDIRPTQPVPAPPLYSVRDYDASLADTGRYENPPMLGSNNWAVSGAHTDSGRALVANDMHLGLSVPNIYYRARLIVTGEPAIDVTGVTLPGAPFVVAGSNGHVAWGYTNSNGDWSDAIVLRAGQSPNTYITPQGEKPFTVHSEVINVDASDAVEYTVRETIWGPVDESANYPDGEIAVSWIAHHPRAVNLNIMRLETAGSVREALAIANTMGMPPQNFVAGDAAGNIGWTIAGQIPVRGDINASVPADWSVQPGWQGWRTPSEYPRIYNPPGGRIWTANARVVDGAALHIVGDGGYDFAARAQQIRNNLQAADRFSAQDMLAIQTDDRAVFLANWRELLLTVLNDEAVGDDDELLEYRRLVENWIPRAVAESTGYRLVRAFRTEVRSRVFAGIMTPVRAQYASDVDLLMSNQFEAPLWQVLHERPMHLLPSNYASWDELMLEAIRSVIRDLAQTHGAELAERTWGERNTAQIRHPLSAAVPLLADWLDMPAEPLSGDSNMPRAQGPNWGASERFSVMPGDEARGLMQMPTGQSGHPMSDFYQKGHADWVHGTPSDFLPGPAQHTLTLRPAGGKIAAQDE